MSTVLSPADPNTVSRAAAALRRGELVAIPTETVYGLGADATNERAVLSIFDAKQRPAFDPLIVHVASADDVARVASPANDDWRALADAFWPGPLTLVMPKQSSISDLVTSGLPTVAVRVPGLAITRDIIAAAGVPIAAPSANVFGSVSPTRAEHVVAGLGDRVRWVVDGGACAVGLESTIVSLVGPEPRLLRLGGLAKADIESALGRDLAEQLTTGDGPDGTARPEAPGQLTRHYAPNRPLHICSSDELEPAANRGLLVALGPAPFSASRYGWVRCLSPAGDVNESARALFSTLRDVEQSSVTDVDVLLSHAPGLGRAIDDRLVRAAVSPNPPVRQ
jgi:L-threonylcarbamoyladenylate synthase